MNPRLVLETTDTTGEEFVAHDAQAAITINVASGDTVELQFKNPDDIWIEIVSWTTSDLDYIQTVFQSSYRFVSTTGGSKAWIYVWSPEAPNQNQDK